LARHLASGTTKTPIKINFIDLVKSVAPLLLPCLISCADMERSRGCRYATAADRLFHSQLTCASSACLTCSSLQTFKQSPTPWTTFRTLLPFTPTIIQNATAPITSSECARITRLRVSGGHPLPIKLCPAHVSCHSLFRQEAKHAAARAAEAALEAEKRAEQIRAAAAAVKQQQKVDKSAAGTL
jgi:hypothetical protein